MSEEDAMRPVALPVTATAQTPGSRLFAQGNVRGFLVSEEGAPNLFPPAYSSTILFPLFNAVERDTFFFFFFPNLLLKVHNVLLLDRTLMFALLSSS